MASFQSAITPDAFDERALSCKHVRV